MDRNLLDKINDGQDFKPI